ncbi:coniferyl-alcohol dehydrogenase [uncultured Amnibacterium sp.]|uniref:coniferyl-alcohol dehydrogenase n=1 Tax=uncultured Amnibacterium sp. TaxID=1631851 RepID=UPI0035CAF72D
MSFTEYENKRVVVTGASSGIGAAVTETLVGLGAEVHAASRRKPTVQTAGFHALDLSDPASIEAAAASIGGPVDVLFNCAGAVPMMPAIEIFKVNFLGTRYLTELLLPQIPSGGSVVNTSSDGGYAWRTKHALILDLLATTTFRAGVEWYEQNEQAAGHAYSFGKEALDLWTMQLSATTIQRGVRVNSTSPGAVQTPMLEAIEGAYTAAAIDPVTVPSGRRSSAEEQVGPLLFLGSDGASYVNGADIQVDGGFGATLNVAGTLWG